MTVDEAAAALRRSTYAIEGGQGQVCPCGLRIHVTAPAAERFIRGNAAIIGHWASGECRWHEQLVRSTT